MVLHPVTQKASLLARFWARTRDVPVGRRAAPVESVARVVRLRRPPRAVARWRSPPTPHAACRLA
jgi:hypothetical protein